MKINILHKKGWIKLIILLLTTQMLCSCSTIFDSRSQKKELMQEYTSGNLKAAVKTVDAKAADRTGTGDALMWQLEEGSINFDAGNYKKSIKALDQAEAIVEGFDKRATINLRAGGAEVGSAFTNLNAIPYKGFNYDRILLNTYKALDYFALGNPEGARVEIRRAYQRQLQAEKRFQSEIQSAQKEIDQQNIKNKQSISFDTLLKNKSVSDTYKELKEKANKPYGNFVNPFVTYLSAISYLSQNDYNNASVDFRNLYRMEPTNPLIQRDMVTTSKYLGYGIPSELSSVQPYNYPLNKNIVFVIFANGLAPALKQVKIQLVLPFVGYTGFAYPSLQYFTPAIKKILISGKGIKGCETVTIADMDSIVSQEYRELLPVIITRIAVSTITKEIASYTAVQAAKYGGRQAGNDNTALAAQILAYIVTGIYKYTFNTADTRCWQTLPKEYQVTHFPMPKNGIVNITPIIAGGFSKKIEVKLNPDNKFTILYVKSPTLESIEVKKFKI